MITVARTADCPNCGAPISFRWEGAVQTTCGFCRSILVRHDVDLELVGKVSHVPESTTPIQLGTEGRYRGTPFTVVGRIVYEYDRGRWNEWHVRLDDGTSAWLSDAQGEYAISRQVDAPSELPSAEAVHVGLPIAVNGTLFRVTSMTTARYGGVEGELPFEYWDRSAMLFADLESKSDRFATIDYSERAPLLFVGEYEEFDELELSNMRQMEGW